MTRSLKDKVFAKLQGHGLSWTDLEGQPERAVRELSGIGDTSILVIRGQLDRLGMFPMIPPRIPMEKEKANMRLGAVLRNQEKA